MCLVDVKRIKNEEDIICYKVLYYDNITSNFYSPYFTRKKWIIGRTESLKDRTLPIVKDLHFNRNVIQEGAYHSYKNLNDAIRSIKHISGRVVVKCVIPKNSKYVYEGVNGIVGASEGYASQKLKPLEIVYDEKLYCFKPNILIL